MTLTVAHRESPKLGEGIYLPIDVSTILRLPYHKVKHLMNNYLQGHAFGDKRNRAVNFYSLIEFYTYYNLKEKGFTHRKIKDFHDMLQKSLNTPYPFASVRVLSPKEVTKKSNPWYEYGGLYIKGDGKQQPSIPSFVKPFLKQLEFGKNDIVNRFFPLYHTKNIVVDPLHQFGQPVVNGTNIQTKTIFNLHDAGESINNICILYDISEKQVHDAIRLHTRIVA
jgi:uncharacterized protein (DUF433 family)